MANITGWGRGTWGQGTWSSPIAVEVTGFSATASLGTAVSDTGIVFGATGVSASALISQHVATTITLAVTVVNPGSGNKYYIDGVQQATLTLYEGNTYRFDQSDSSNSGHPLRLSETSNGTHAGGSAYTTGVTTNGTPGSSGAYTEITVASGAPTLYYYCSNHSAMGGTANTPAILGFHIVPTGVSGTTALGTASSAAAGATVPVTGVTATNSVGNGTFVSPSSIGASVTGVSATGGVGEEIFWQEIIPSQTPNWLDIAA